MLGDKVSKHYQSPTNLTVQKLGTFTDTAPQLVLPDWVTRAEVTITAPDGTAWTGDASTCNTYTYAANGDYQIIVKAYHQENEPPADAQGWYAYRAGYTMSMAPTVTLSSDRAAQGSVVALYLTGILDGEPSLETDLGTVWFRRTAGGYMGYIPITYNAEGGDHTLQLTCGSLTRDLTLTVTNTQHKTVELPAEEDVGGAEEYRNAIWPLYTNSTGQKLWNGLFVAPSSSAIAVHYGDIQMRDGQRSGQSTGLTYSAPDNETITAPQSGTVVLADTLTLTGGTVVIDHGCGVKSYLFGLKTITAQRGQTIEAGSPVGTAGTDHDLIFELRIGSKSVDPEPAMAGRSGLQYRESNKFFIGYSPALAAACFSTMGQHQEDFGKSTDEQEKRQHPGPGRTGDCPPGSPAARSRAPCGDRAWRKKPSLRPLPRMPPPNRQGRAKRNLLKKQQMPPPKRRKHPRGSPRRRRRTRSRAGNAC